MGVININTPEGVIPVKIAGDTPTEEELDRLRKLSPSDTGEPFDYSVATEEVKVEKPVVEDPEGEVTDTWLRYQLSRMDTDEEKQNLLNQLLGEGTSRRVEEDTFIIDQSKIAPEIRERYNLADSGSIYLDEPGFTLQDIIDFGGESGPSVVAAIGASIAATGIGFIPGMAIVGGAAALAKAADEGIEWAQGLNRQSAGEVAGMIATEGVLNAFFEGGGRLVAKGIGRLFKGPGPQVSTQRIEQFIATGMTRKKARRVATEEARARFRQMVTSGARPSVQAAAGKALAARALAVNEKIMPNPRVGEENVTFITKLLKDVDDGIVSKEDAIKLLYENDHFIANLIGQKLADPEQAFKITKQHLDDIVKTELARYKAKFVPSERLPEEYSEALQLVSTLFRTESNNLYDIAGKTMGPDGVFSIQPIKDVIKSLKKENPFGEYKGTLFNKLEELEKLPIGQLQQLKATLRLSKGDPDLVASSAQAGIGKIIKAVDKILDGEFSKLSLDLARGFKVVEVAKGTQIPSPVSIKTALGAVDQPTMVTTSVTYKAVPLVPGEKEALRQGLAQWRAANTSFGEGQEQFNNVAVNTIMKKTRDKYFNSNRDILRVLVEEGNTPKLKMYLDAITPNSTLSQRIVQPGATEAIERVRGLVNNNQFRQASDLIEESGFSGILPKVAPWIDELPADDVFKVLEKGAYLKELDNFIYLSRAGTDPRLIRESVRNSVAKQWLNNTRRESLDNIGEFSPGQFATRFKALGDDMQNTLFGAETASSMREAMDAFRLIGLVDDATKKQLFDAIPTMVDQSLKTEIQVLKEISDRAVSESGDAVLNAIQKGTITNPSDLIPKLLSNPASYKKLANVVGDAELEKVGGVKDMVINNLIYNSFGKTPLDEITLQSGAWGKALKDTIMVQNKNGALNTILGVDVVKALTRLADDAVDVSDVAIKGFGGIAAAPAAIAMVSMIASGQWVTAAGTAAGVIILSRALRNRGILKLLTSPRMRAREYEKAIAAGADLPSLAASRQAGEISYAINRISSLLATESAIVAGSGIFGEMEEESIKRVQSQLRPSQTRQRSTEPGQRRPDVFSSPAPISREAWYGARTSSDVLRGIETDKLLGRRQ